MTGRHCGQQPMPRSQTWFFVEGNSKRLKKEREKMERSRYPIRNHVHDVWGKTWITWDLIFRHGKELIYFLLIKHCCDCLTCKRSKKKFSFHSWKEKNMYIQLISVFFNVMELTCSLSERRKKLENATNLVSGIMLKHAFQK